MKYKIEKSKTPCPFHGKTEWLIINKSDADGTIHSYCIECILTLIKEVEEGVGKKLPTVEEYNESLEEIKDDNTKLSSSDEVHKT